ncbi:nucleotidyltransferase family protein [Natronomonas sp.]|uniref:nucleotidyltransferase family protein n=1 Tax=Natronomonas sp. TaxID=2184060 RepID=UPI002604F21B|nr:nucleotidyltransferase family protein [Natronomonas sp.]
MSDDPSDHGLAVVEPPFEADGADGADGIAGVVLAAGTSERFGAENKLLATVEGEAIVRRSVRTLLAAGLDPIVVVVGHEADAVGAAVSDLPVSTVENDAYESGQASSVRAGIDALEGNGRPEAEAEAAVVALGDMPFVDPGTVESLVSAYRSGVADALAAATDGVRGNPVLFDRRFFEELTAIDGDTGGRSVLLEGPSAALVDVEDRGVRRDVDVRSDLDAA